jgi:hypothetical protein
MGDAPAAGEQREELLAPLRPRSSGGDAARPSRRATPAITELYAGKGDKTISRDLNALEDMELIRPVTEPPFGLRRRARHGPRILAAAGGRHVRHVVRASRPTANGHKFLSGAQTPGNRGEIAAIRAAARDYRERR